MAISDDIRQIGKQALDQLNGVHDFLEHSRFSWDFLTMKVRQGETIAHTNLATGTIVDQTTLINLIPKYKDDYLLQLTFRQFVSIFESFFFRFMERIFLHNPWSFARSQLDFEAVLRAADRDEIMLGVIRKQLNDLKYESPREWFAALKRTVRISSPSDDDIESIAELKATRDIIEHNDGVVNATYFRKAGKKARNVVGIYLDLDDNYFLECWRLVIRVVDEVCEEAAVRLVA